MNCLYNSVKGPSIVFNLCLTSLSSFLLCLWYTLLYLPIMGDHQQIEEGAPLNIHLRPSTSRSPRSSNRGQGRNSAPLLAIIFSLIAAISCYVVFQMQSKKLSLRDEHGNIVIAAFVILYLYVMTVVMGLGLQNPSNCCLATMKKYNHLIGQLVPVLLLFVISSFLGYIGLTAWAVLAAEATTSLLPDNIQWLGGIFRRNRTNQSVTSDSIGIQENNALRLSDEASFVQNQNLPV